MTRGSKIEGLPNETWTVDQLLRSISSWGNSVKFVSYERTQQRLTENDKWMEDVGTRIIAAIDILRIKLRDKTSE